MKDLKAELAKKLKKMSQKGAGIKAPVFNSIDEYRNWQNEQAKIDSQRIAHDARVNYVGAMMRESDVALADNTFANYETTEEWQFRLVESAREYMEGLREGNGNLNLVICGEYGSGKTHLACAIVNHFTNEIGGVGLAKQFNVLIRNLWRYKEEPKKAAATRHHALNVEILLIDEVGAAERELYDSQIGELGEIIRTRVNNRKPTIITTNWEAREFKEQIDSFVFGGLRQGGLTVFEIPKNEKRDQRKKANFNRF